MSLFKPRTWGISRVWSDIANYRDWIRVIKREKKNINSPFNKWKIEHNPFYTIHFTMDVKEEELQLPETVMKLRLVESLAPLHRYLDEELGFAECLTPEFNQYVDAETGEPSLTYLISYRFSFNKLSFWWVVRWLSITISVLVALKLGIVPWLMGLI